MHSLMFLYQVNSQMLVNINSYVMKMMNMFGVPLGDKTATGDQVCPLVLTVSAKVL